MDHLSTYTYFKFELSSVHLTMSRFFIKINPSGTLLLVLQCHSRGERIHCKKVRHPWKTLNNLNLKCVDVHMRTGSLDGDEWSYRSHDKKA
jgi:hypothetical protein